MIFKISAKLSKFLPAAATTPSRTANWSHRAFVSAAPNPLQSKKADEKAYQEVKEAAEAVKSTAETVSKLTKETVESLKEKAKDAVSWGAAKAAAEVMKRKKGDGDN